MMSPAPREIPPLKSPALKRGDRIDNDDLRKSVGKSFLKSVTHLDRTRRSFGATSSSTPLFFLSPSFHLRNNTVAYGSMSRPSIELTLASTSWMPDWLSSSASFPSIAARVAGWIMFA
jgi:hypothetical protein